MQGAIPVDEQFFKNLLISLHTGSGENEIVRFQIADLNRTLKLRGSGIRRAGLILPLSRVKNSRQPFQPLSQVLVAKPDLDCLAALSDFLEKSKPELK